jgi:acetylornithine deacetylase
MLDSKIAGAIRDAVDRGFDQQVDFTAELVKFPSLRGAEASAQDFVAQEFRARGLHVDRWRIELDAIKHLHGFSPVTVDYDNAINVVGSHRAQNPAGHSLILNGHIDVVPVGPMDMWTSPPFQPRVADGWMYGRGAGDMKAGIAAMVFALDAVRKAGYEPAADVHLQSVVEEECTGNGALACAARGYRAEAAIIPEPFNNTLTRAQVGVLWLQITVRGMPVHVLEAQAGANAIEAAFEIIQALHQLEEKWNVQRHEHEHFAHLDHPINFNVGKIAGGDWPSSVPAWCTFDLRAGIYPGQDPAAKLAEVSECVMQAAQRLPFLRKHPPQIVNHGLRAWGYVLPKTDAAGAAQAILQHAHHAAFDGAQLRTQTSTGATDARALGQVGGTPVLVYGPRAESIHGFDERVELDSMRRVTQTIALFMAEWCGLVSQQ